MNGGRTPSVDRTGSVHARGRARAPEADSVPEIESRARSGPAREALAV
jgi:hypothetical protein